MKNTLLDLNNHLFAQLERLSDEDVTGGKLTEEIERSKAVGSIAAGIVSNARLVLDAQKAMGDSVRKLPEFISIEHEPEA